jgi:hypothetical protein
MANTGPGPSRVSVVELRYNIAVPTAVKEEVRL